MNLLQPSHISNARDFHHKKKKKTETISFSYPKQFLLSHFLMFEPIIYMMNEEKNNTRWIVKSDRLILRLDAFCFDYI